MLRSRFALGVACCGAALAALLPATALLSADPPKPAAPTAPAEVPAAAEMADPFAVPETNDDKALQMFLQRLVQTQPDEPTPAGITGHLNKIDGVVGKIMAKPISDPFYRSVAELRLQIYKVLADLGDKDAKARTDAYLKELAASTRPGVPDLSKRFLLQARVENIADLDEAAQKALVADIVAMVKAVPKGDDEALQFSVQMAMTVGELLQRADSPVAPAAFASIVEVIKARNDERLTDLVSSMEGTMRRLQLPGNPIEIQGKTVDGKPFNINELKGKVVLVDFWATWCGPCIAEMPHLKELYEAYHAKGFEVVGISLDSERAELERFLEVKEIKWPILFEEGEGASWDNKTAQYYGISAIPAMILVNREGKVVSTSLRGPALDEELAKLLGPLPATVNKPAGEKPTEK
ncbi:TlpA family protein disulfide reductase [Planctomicrobium piriforme]|uniref:Thiol-disulfide isomerase or thioredoxin n=1 Tax=Planctomicrobium piriforme TaxID=1576369 RepID=A0A1I3RM69_9PLAN|nr:TlpA disulfide reductase family protein [Planctomicrobium piriforme]SFJ46962.1 Thiol-disulfide isomerase or thioredoxin [Planctomicrobium piriforme]